MVIMVSGSIFCTQSEPDVAFRGWSAAGTAKGLAFSLLVKTPELGVALGVASTAARF